MADGDETCGLHRASLRLAELSSPVDRTSVCGLEVEIFGGGESLIDARKTVVKGEIPALP